MLIFQMRVPTKNIMKVRKELIMDKITESSRDMPSASRCCELNIAVIFSNVKAPFLSVIP